VKYNCGEDFDSDLAGLPETFNIRPVWRAVDRQSSFLFCNRENATMGLIKEFKDFAMKGNVVDMAVGIIIGAGFGKIVGSLVNDVIMPPIGMLIGGVSFTELKVSLGKGPEKVLANGTKEAAKEVYLNYGAFLQTVFDFLIVAAAVFAIIKIMNTAKAKFEKQEAAAPAAPPEDVLLLREIRDALKSR
jgi:large conductance mechanosensitive channel